MFSYIVRRLLYAIPILLVTTFAIFVFVSVASNPLAQLHQNPHITRVEIARIAHAKHLDESVFVRYGRYMWQVLHGNFGTGLTDPRPIGTDLLRVMGTTAQLLIPALLISIIVGIAIGIYSAVRQYSIFDYFFTTASFVGYAIPVFWLGLMLQIAATDMYTSWHVRLFYIFGISAAEPGTGFHFVADRIQHLALPVLALSAAFTAAYSRYMRASMLEVINSDYTRTARAKGLSERKVIGKHVFRNALIPVVTQVALDFGGLLAGAIVTENVFAIDGMGTYFLHYLTAGDPYPITAWLIVVVLSVIIFNLIADVVYGVLDPRIRYD